MGKLTDIELRKWIKAGAPVVKSDGGGLYFTMSAKQAIERAGSWIVRYRFDGKGRELTLGRYPEISLAVARGLTMEARAKIQQGTDVARAIPCSHAQDVFTGQQGHSSEQRLAVSGTHQRHRLRLVEQFFFVKQKTAYEIT
mgnify:CR=1 FL=1